MRLRVTLREHHHKPCTTKFATLRVYCRHVIWFQRTWLTFGYRGCRLRENHAMFKKRRIQDGASGPTTYIARVDGARWHDHGPRRLVFCGTVEGDCDINGPLTLAKGGHWKGILKATDIVVAGTVEGDVVAKQRVEILGSARITGSLSGNSIAVAEGAIIEGEIKVTNGEPPTTFQEKRQP